MILFKVISGDIFKKEILDPLHERALKSGNENNDDFILDEKINKTMVLLENPRHPGLESHEIKELSRRYKKKKIAVFESYIENRNSKARRLYWYYEEGTQTIIVVGYSEHPENTKFAYRKLKFPDLKKYESFDRQELMETLELDERIMKLFGIDDIFLECVSDIIKDEENEMMFKEGRV